NNWSFSPVVWTKIIQRTHRLADITQSSSIKNRWKGSMKTTVFQTLTIANKLLTNKDKANTSSLLAFRLKLLSGMLLSRQLLHDRYLNTYTDSLCPRCLTAVET
ncbi:2220_t:CDS:1, partial [Acaulospora morrowiae]